MNNCDRHKLLGSYVTPNVPEGTVLWCEHRKCWVPFEGFSDAPLRWPVGRRPRTSRMGLIVTGGLADALRLESALAVRWWWGMSMTTLWRMRQALCVEQFTTGTRRLRLACLDAEVRRQRVADMRAGSGNAGEDMTVRLWSPEEDEKVLSLPTKEAAARTGRTITAVNSRRQKLCQLRPGCLSPGIVRGRRWTEPEDRAVRGLPLEKAAKKVGRTKEAVRQRRRVLALSCSRSPALVQPLLLDGLDRQNGDNVLLGHRVPSDPGLLPGGQGFPNGGEDGSSTTLG